MELRMPNDVVEQEQTTAQEKEEVKDNRQYWEKTWDNLCPGIIFKLSKIPPLERLTVFYNRQAVAQKGHTVQSSLDMIKYWQWSKDGGITWSPIVNNNGSLRLEELETNLALIVDLGNLFQDEVLLPVFIESKTYQK